jgi:hypothetical protein
MPSGRMLCCDPGETTGFSIWAGAKVIGGGQTPLWQFAHDVWDALADNVGPLSELQDDLLHPGVSQEENTGPITLMVIEKFALYPWLAKELAWNEFRTVQLIGALVFMAELHDVEVEKQAANIKERAMAAGAGELFVRPLRENRHQNDSLQHGVWYNLTHQAAA